MDADVALVNLAPLLPLLALAALLALLPLSWVWLRSRGSEGRGAAHARLATLTALTLFLTFDLIVFGAFTRLSDSGLGCPDWPGCYGAMTPFGASEQIRAAETAMPTGPVTWSKAWIEMIHRYLAMTVGALILVMAVWAWTRWRAARRAPAAPGSSSDEPLLPVSPWWPTVTLVWVLVQGMFGKYTVTLKLYPAVVTLHLLGGLTLLALLAIQHAAFRRQAGQPPLALVPGLRRLAWIGLGLLGVQIALGGWVSTNYAVLACSGFPTCNGQWWPAMDWAQGFEPLRHLGMTGGGELLSFEALVAIHMAHRLGAVVVVAVLGGLAWGLWRAGRAGQSGASGPGAPAAASALPLRRFGWGLALLLALQVVSGLSNVVLGWPLLAALGHSAGAAALVLVLTLLLARSAAPSPDAVATRGSGLVAA
jgi:heme a synthase